MNIDDTKKLLIFIQAGDKRKLSEADLALWAEEVPDRLELEDALQAVRDFRARPETELMRYPYLDLTVFRVFVKRILDRRNAAARAEVARAAIEPAPHIAVTKGALRQRDPEEFQRLHDEGRATGNADRAYTYARRHGAPEVEAREAGQAAYQETLAAIEAEKNRADRQGGKHTSPAGDNEPKPITFN
ncbi:helicase loader [Arthrobacter phage Bolt007]|uniref:Helicase loader n=1 Tax=Arthrobacter phage Bolt007 TaxID=3017297 RepID=A0AA49E5H4_9CAUD|nr:helicase loader [Arthrobacter phage Bolt007]